MSDSNVDVDDLDAFSSTFFGSKPAEVKEDNEVTETPSATEEAETPVEAEVEESTSEEDDGDDAPAEDETPEAEEEEAEDTPIFKVKGKKSIKERINELTRAAREAERRADALARDLEAARSQKSEPKPRQDAPKLDANTPDPDETLEDGTLKYPLGEFDKTYIADLTRFTIRKEMEQERAQDQVNRQNEEMARAETELQAHWSEKLDTAAERLPDFKEKVVELEDTFRDLEPNYGKYLASTIMLLEYGPDVLNYLADNPAEARKIVNSGPTQATIALGRIEARFVAGKEVEREPVVQAAVQTQAPPPPPRTRGSGGKAGVPADTDDLDAFSATFFK